MKFSDLQRLQRREGITVTSADDRIEQIERRLHTITEDRDALRAELDALKGQNQEQHTSTFQSRVKPWLLECFGEAIASDREERNHRFLEEAIELVQALGCSAHEAHQLVGYVFGRPVGEPRQEVGGVMVTLAALCLANGLDMHADGEVELQRINVPETVLKIRAKQAAKPKHSPLAEVTASCPKGSKVQLLTRYGCAIYGTWTGKETIYDGWAPLPTRAPGEGK